MKQFEFSYIERNDFITQLQQLKGMIKNYPKIMFQIFSDQVEAENFLKVGEILDEVFPEAVYFGCTTCGNIVNGELMTSISVICTVFEHEDSDVSINEYDIINNSVEDITAEITAKAEMIPNLKAIELYFAITDMSPTKFCKGLDSINKDVHIFGGISCSLDISASDSLVYVKGNKTLNSSLIAVFYKGEQLHVESLKETGWKPIGKEFTITKADGNILYELDGISAYDIYHKYLNIHNDENFFENTLEFPLFYNYNNEKILRVPLSSNADNSITMSSEVKLGEKVRICYGDPNTIIRSINEDSVSIRKFTPDVIHIFSCGARRTFWGTHDATYELESIKDIAPLSGFFSHGEFIRTKNHLNMHNVTLILAAMREGDVKENVVIKDYEAKHKVPLITRLSRFITETTNQITEMNEKLNRERNYYHNVLTRGCVYNCTVDITDGYVENLTFNNDRNDIFKHYNLKTPMHLDDMIRFYMSFHKMRLVDQVNFEIKKEMTVEEMLEKYGEGLTQQGLLKQFNKGIKNTETIFYDYELETYLRISVFMSEDESSGHIFGLLLAQDITERWNKKLEHERLLNESVELANQASEAKTSFLANMSHEIRTPMNAVLGMAEMALREEMSDDAREYIHQIKNSGKNLLVIINDVLDFSKIESGKLDIVKISYEPLSLINDLSNIVNTRIGGNNVEFTMDIDPSLPKRLYGDNIRIQQILINLLNNAVKFTRQGKVHLNLKCEFLDSETVILNADIVDTGIGIKSEDIGKLFKSFQQVDSKRNRNIEGTGLGLAISQRLLELMDGMISVSSVYNEGSTFSFSLPQKVEEPAEPIQKIISEECMIYSDNIYVKEQLQNDLDKIGISYCEAENEDAVLSSKPMILITERNMFTESIMNMVTDNPDMKCILLVPFNSSEKFDITNIKVLRKPVYSVMLYSALGIVSEYIRASDIEDNILSFTAPDAEILIVDDTEINLTVAKGLLAPFNMKIDTAHGASEAINLIQKTQYDIIFMDHMMPEIDGVEATHIIRKKFENYANTPIIALTANAVGDVEEMFIREGMNDFVAKPIDIKTITLKLHKWLPKDKVKASDEKVVQNEGNAEEINIEGLNTAEAVKMLGTAEMFWTVLETYYKNIDKKSEIIRKFYNEKNIRNYTIEVHSLKSTSRQIGADELADLAARLEAAGNNNEIDLINEKTDEMLEMFLKYKEILSPYFNDEESCDAKQCTPEQLEEMLVKIENALDSFDTLLLDEVIEEMSGFLLDEDKTKLFDELKNASESFDIDTCRDIVSQIREKN